MLLATSSDSERRPKEMSLVNCSQPHLGGLASVFCELLGQSLHDQSTHDARRDSGGGTRGGIGSADGAYGSSDSAQHTQRTRR